jgi:mRNA interferase RelE/StbE
VTRPPFDVAWTATAKRMMLRLPEKVATAVIEFVYGPLTANPHRVGRELRLDLTGLWSARRGDYRVLYRINDKLHRIEIVAVDHRRDIYRAKL